MGNWTFAVMYFLVAAVAAYADYLLGSKPSILWMLTTVAVYMLLRRSVDALIEAVLLIDKRVISIERKNRD